MTDLLTPSQIRELEGIFRTYDTSGEGLIDHKELGVMLRAMGMHSTEAEVQDMIAVVDADGSGKLDFAEFVNLMASRLKDTDIESEEAESFARFDKDGDGVISFEDLEKAIAALDETYPVADIREMIKEANLSGAAGITYQDFQALLRSN